MPHTPNTPQTLLDQLSEIQDEAKKNKVQLTPEVVQYIREHLEAVQKKLAKNESIYDEDLEFIKNVRFWINLPENVRQMFPAIEEMKKESEDEAMKRNITPKQWFDLLHVAKAAGKQKEWIDATFKFPGKCIIEAENLELKKCPITHLPDNLKINNDLNIHDCNSLTKLPDNLQVIKSMFVEYCTSLKSVPNSLKVGWNLAFNNCKSLTFLPDNLNVNMVLNLNECTSLTFLPQNLNVKGYLYLIGCVSLASLPTNIMVYGSIILSKNVSEQVKKDAERLKQKGKIKGEINYQ